MGPEIASAFAGLSGLALAAMVGVVGFRATRNGRGNGLPSGLSQDIREIREDIGALRDLTTKTCTILDERLPRA